MCIVLLVLYLLSIVLSWGCILYQIYLEAKYVDMRFLKYLKDEYICNDNIFYNLCGLSFLFFGMLIPVINVYIAMSIKENLE